MEYEKGNLISQMCPRDILNICVTSRYGEKIGKSKMYTR